MLFSVAYPRVYNTLAYGAVASLIAPLGEEPRSAPILLLLVFLLQRLYYSSDLSCEMGTDQVGQVLLLLFCCNLISLTSCSNDPDGQHVSEIRGYNKREHSLVKPYQGSHNMIT